jgi:putative tricarboxylic transport membrane protein
MRRDQWTALGLVLFALVYMGGAWKLPRFALSTGVVDAHVFPLVLGTLLLLLSAALYLQGARQAKGAPLFDGVNRPLLLKLIGATVAYALVLSPLGFVLATSLFLTAAMFLLGRRKWGSTVAIGVGFSAVVYGLFAYVLNVPLARGILPF